MIGIDSNIILRYLTQDDRPQALLANEIFERRLSADEPGFVNLVAVVEVVWVLQRSYRYSRTEIAHAIEHLLQVDVVVVEQEQEVFAAMRVLKRGMGSFADALIGAMNAKAGCRCTLTFDRKALRISGFEHP